MFLTEGKCDAASLQCLCLQDQTKIITDILFTESVIIWFDACVADNKQMIQRFFSERCLWKNEDRQTAHVRGLLFTFVHIFLRSGPCGVHLLHPPLYACVEVF